MKNELIIARKKGNANARAAGRLKEMLAALGLQELEQRFNLQPCKPA